MLHAATKHVAVNKQTPVVPSNFNEKCNNGTELAYH